MALTRKFLAALGIEPDKVDEIIEAHTDTTNALKEERDKYKADHEALPAIQKELEELKAAAEKDQENPYKAQYEDLRKEYDQYKSDVEARDTKAKKKEAFKALLKQIGVSEKRLDSVLRVSKFEDVELDKDGKIKGIDDLKKELSEEWKDFIVTDETHGAETKTPPTGVGSGNPKTQSRAAMVAARHNEMVYGVKGENK